MSKEYFISIIIPFRNEAMRIGPTIKAIDSYLDKKDFKAQVILADSHSTDGSLEVAKKYADEFDYICYTEPKTSIANKGGKGMAIQDGIGAADGEYIMFMDADSSTPIEELDKLFPFLKGYDIVMGSRYIKEPRPYKPNYFWGVFHGIKSIFEVLIFGHSKDYQAKGKQGRVRQIISRGGNFIFTLLLNQSYVDQRCGFKLYHANVAKLLASLQKIMGFGFDTEYLAIAQKYKLKTIEVPVEWYDDTASKVDPIKDTINSFKDIFKVQWNLLTGKYSKRHARRKLGSLFEEVVLNEK